MMNRTTLPGGIGTMTKRRRLGVVLFSWLRRLLHVNGNARRYGADG